MGALMKILGSFLLGSAACLTVVGVASAADLPTRKSSPAEYLRVCNTFGAGYFVLPGSDTCLKIGGTLREEVIFRGGAPTGALNQFGYNAAGAAFPRDLTNFRSRYYFVMDARSQTEYGELKGYFRDRFTDEESPPGPFGGGKITVAGLPAGAKGSAGFFQGYPGSTQSQYLEAAYVQWAGITAGRAQSFFDFYIQGYELSSNTVSVSNQPINLFAYTAKFGNGFSATVSAEDPDSRRIGDSSLDTAFANVNPTKTTAAYLTYGGMRVPEIVGNLKIEQGWGSAQIAGALHQVNSSPIGFAGKGSVLAVGDQPSDEWGFAAEGGVRLKLDQVSPGDTFTAQVSYSQGAMDYVNALNYYNGTSNVYDHNLVVGVPVNDAFVLPDGSIGLSKAGGAFAGYQHFWVPTVKSTLFGSFLRIQNPDAAQLIGAGADNATVWDVGFNTVWTPVKGLDLGAEAVYTNIHLSGLASLATAAVNPAGAKIPLPASDSDVRGRVRIQYSW
jgi:hypothetical protein